MGKSSIVNRVQVASCMLMIIIPEIVNIGPHLLFLFSVVKIPRNYISRLSSTSESIGGWEGSVQTSGHLTWNAPRMLLTPLLSTGWHVPFRLVIN